MEPVKPPAAESAYSVAKPLFNTITAPLTKLLRIVESATRPNIPPI